MKAEGSSSSESSSEAIVATTRGRGRLLPRASLGTRLSALSLVATLPAIALALWNTRQEPERRIDEVRQQAVRGAGLIASEYRRIMDTGRGVLVAVANLPQVVGRE